MIDVNVVYASLSGNTERVGELIGESLKEMGYNPLYLNVTYKKKEVENLDLSLPTFFGTYTWGDGELPSETRRFLKQMVLSDLKGNIAVYGTGEQLFKHYCRAVRESRHHLAKAGWNVFDTSLQIEQRPKKSETEVIKQWTKDVMEEFSYDEGN